MATLVAEREALDILDYDYEPLSDDELVQIARAEKNLASGNFSSWENARIRLLNLP